MVMEGKNIRLAQFNAIMHCFGTKLGYYNPTDWKQARYVDPVVCLWGDIQDCASAVLFAPDDKKAECIEKYGGLTRKAVALFESMLCHHNGKFIGGNNVTIADFVLASWISVHVMNDKSPFQSTNKAIVKDFPKFYAYGGNLHSEMPYLKARAANLGPF